MSESNKSERSRKLKCLDCNKIFQLPHGSNSAIHPQRYCADCLEADPLNAVASSDHQSDVGANADDYENLECSRCGKCFKSQAALKYHTNKNVCQKSGAALKKQAVVVLLDEDGDGKQAKAFACSVCKKVMKSRQAHAYHMKMKLCEKASGDQPPPQKKMKPNASEDAGDGRESPTNRLQWCQPKDRRTEKMFQTWTHSSTAPLGIRAMCTSMISEAEVLTNLLRNMWDFSDAVALSTWIAEYLMSYSVDGVQTVNLWPLYPVDLCLDEPEAAIDSFSSLDDRMNAKSGEYSKINVFESAFNCTSRSSTATYDDVVINAAGPVWVTAFAPLSANRDTTATTGQIRIWQRRHFVVGVSRIGYINELYPLPSSVRALMVDGGIGPGYDIPHDLFNPQKHDNILQVWSTTMGGSVGDVSGNPSNVTQLCYCVALNKRGAVFKAEWSPGFFAKDADCSSRSADLHDPVSCLGMLAVVCEDGSCLIMFPPIKVANTTHQAAAGYSVPNVPVLSEESVCRFRLSLDAAITCMSWSPHVHLKLCCGHSDGSISIWLLPSTEQRPKKSTSSTGYAMIELIRPVVRIVDSEATKIRSVSFCPYNVDLILSVGYDTKIKIWKSSKVFKPVVSRQTGSVWSLDALWDPFGNGCYAASAETPTVLYEPLWAAAAGFVKTMKLVRHAAVNGGVWKMDLFVPGADKGYLSVAGNCAEDCGTPKLATVASDGTVCVCEVPRAVLLKSKKGNSGISAMLFRMHRVVIKTNESSESTCHVYFSSSKYIFDERSEEYRICLPSVAMQALDSCAYCPGSSSTSMPMTNIDYCKRLFVYGGAVGMVRLHTVSLPWF